MILENQEASSTQQSKTNQAPAPPPVTMLSLLLGKHITYAISAIARLGVPDHMSVNQACPVSDVANATGAHEPSLYRMLRALTIPGVVEEGPKRCFRLTAVGSLLRSDAAGSMRYLAIQFGDVWSTRAMEHFSESLQTGADGVTKAFGEQIFDYFRHEPEQAETFHRSMTGLSGLMSDSIANAYDFAGMQRIADIGGGRGLLVASILKKNPHLTGLIYDLPEVVTGAEEEVHVKACANKIQFEGGSFFQTVPGGCDAYLMKLILHDWSDQACSQILTNIREKMAPSSRLLVCEQVISDAPESMVGKLLDLEMLAMTPGGRERTRQEFDDLFASAGLRLERVIPTDGPLYILEAKLA